MSSLATAPTVRSEPALLVAGYARTRGVYDELVDHAGRVRPHWRRFLDGFAALGPRGRQAAAEGTRRHLRESGIAFNVYADPDDRAHAWRLDLLPLLLPEREWERLAAGIAQRARLLDAALADLYGARRLLLDGVLPPSAVLGADEHVRPQIQHERPSGPMLQSYACDIARRADGSWVVLGDQTDCAVGNGYVIASRVALSHGLGELFTGCNTRRLARYFMTIQTALQEACQRDDGRIVILAPGANTSCYFSHAYLARYLGYTLAESGDLTVRDARLHLKTLDGLQRVDLLLRKVPGHTLDPLFLPGRGLAGVAGLVQIARSGNVTIANPMGSGLAQHRALAPWHEALAHRLLGEKLMLPDQETLWLGDPAALAKVKAQPDAFRISAVRARNDPGAPLKLWDPAAMDPVEYQNLLERLEQQGWRYVALRPIAVATAPSYDGKGLVPTPFAIRCFAARHGQGYAVLPGGLVRLAGSPELTALPNGFGSKDLWVTAETAEHQSVSLLSTTLHRVHLRRTGRDLLSRTADNLFWLGRYAERAEGIMRTLRSVLARLLEDGRPDADPEVLHGLLEVLLKKGPRVEPDSAAEGPPTLEDLAAVLMFEPRAFGLRDSLDDLHRTATLARDQISHDAWRMLNGLHVDRRWREPRHRLPTSVALELLDDGIRALNAFSGTEGENMTRNFAWRFLEMGRRIERSAHLVELTRELVRDRPAPAGGRADPGLHLLLELGDSFMTYRSRYVMMPLLAPVLDLLLLDETNPRGVAFQISEIESHLARLPSADEETGRTAEQRLALKLSTALRLSDARELAQVQDNAGQPALAALLGQLASGLPQLSDLIVRSQFAHAEPPIATLAVLRPPMPQEAS